MYKLFVVCFSRETTEKELTNLFGEFGDVVSVRIITDQETGLSKGYGFVNFADQAGARLAVRDMDGHVQGDRTVYVRFADQQSPPQQIQPCHDQPSENVISGRKKRPRISR